MRYALIVLLFLSGPAWSQKAIVGSDDPFSTAGLYRDCTASAPRRGGCEMFLTGAAMLQNPEAPMFCVPMNTPKDTIREKFVKWLDVEEPRAADLALSVGVLRFFQVHYPC